MTHRLHHAPGGRKSHNGTGTLIVEAQSLEDAVAISGRIKRQNKAARAAKKLAEHEARIKMPRFSWDDEK